MQDKETKYVPWLTFAIVVTIATIIVGGAYAFAQGAMNLGQENSIDIVRLETQYTGIRSDLTEIKDILKSK